MKNRKLLLPLVIAIIVVIVGVGGYLVWQQTARTKSQNDALKSANEAFKDDPRYVSFGANYIFAVAKSFAVDETLVGGVQMLLPGSGSVKQDTVDKLYDVGAVAVQALTEVKANDNDSFKKHINDKLIPDLKKALSEDVSVAFSMTGPHQKATLVIKKDGKEIRQLYAFAGPRPFLAVAKDKSDAFNEVTASLIDINDSKLKDDIEAIKKAVEANLTLLQKDKIAELYEGGTAGLKKQTSVKDLTSAASSASSQIHRNIVATGGSLQNDQFAGQLYFASPNKDEKGTLGLIALRKEDGQWKLDSLRLPSGTQEKR